MRITKEFTFDAAHNLTEYEGKCESLHGHTYKLHVTLECPVAANGLAFDFVTLKKEVEEKVLNKLDHVYLNELIPQSTAENIAIWIWNKLQHLPLHEIKVWETPTSFVAYQGN